MIGRDGQLFLPCTTWQLRMLKAASYAALAHSQPLYQGLAQGSLVPAYSLALVDSLGTPRLVDVDISEWTGGIGQTIHIRVMDDFLVLEVRVMIRESNLSERSLEGGHAWRSESDPWLWTYITQTCIPQKPGFCVDVLTSDLCGNLGGDTMEFR